MLTETLVQIDSMLPALTGSDKQVSWAKAIRADKIAEMTMGRSEALRAQLIAVCAKATDAKFWIDNRNNLQAAIRTLMVTQ